MPDVAFGSVFTGIGGIDLGLHRAGMRCALQVEDDPYRRSVPASHWPHVTGETAQISRGRKRLLPPVVHRRRSRDKDAS